MKKIISLLLTFALIIGCVSVATVAYDVKGNPVASFPFVTVSDIHYYPESLMGNRSDEWMKFCRLESKCFNESEAILRNALDNIVARADEKGYKYVLLPGDLTKDSEYEAHTSLAAILKEYQEKTDLKFLVTTGNHDINNADACSFVNDTKEPARSITAAEFPQVYKDFGYGDAIDRYAYPEKGDEIQGALSYVYDLDENFRLISVDSSIYGFTDEPQKPPTGGTVTDELNQWIKGWAEKTYAEGKTPFVMVHHNMAPHMEVEPSITFAFTLDDYLDVAEKWASWGINYCFTGHLHTNDTSSVTNDDGQTLYDLESDSVTGFPNLYRENVISQYADGTSSMSTDAVDFDSDVAFTFDGVTYDKGTYKNKSFNLCFGGGASEDGLAGMTGFLTGMVKAFAGSYITDIAESGGIVSFLKTMDIDLEGILNDFLSPYIGKGIKIGDKTLFSTDNIMAFINDLDEQITTTYLENPEKLYGLIENVIAELASMEVSDYPCDRFVDTIGFGDKEKKGTLSDLMLSAMYYWYTGNEDGENDRFLMDACDKFAQGPLTEKLFDKVLDLVVNKLLLNEILDNVDIRLEKLLSDTRIQNHIKTQIQNIGKILLKGNNSYKHLIDAFFSLEILPYDNLLDALMGYLLDEYLTDSQFEGTGNFIAYVIKDFSCDSDPDKNMDFGTMYRSDVVKPEVSRENYRLPTQVAVTLGDDSATSANISFLTKSTLDGDIEIYKADSEPVFTGSATKDADFDIDVATETVTRSYPGIDIGVFGLFNYEYKINRTEVKLTNLEPGSTYYYRVGNEKYGWWSETGTITTADGGKNVTFIHAADPQSQTVDQYNRSWVKVLGAAFDAYPDTDFIVSTGDLVDHGDNSKQWSMMFDTASDKLMNSFLMSASGNHEGKGTNALADRFVLPNAPKQDTTSGVYYSFDYNNVHIAVLNTNDLNSKNALSDEQTKWLKNDMQSSDAQWKFVALHKAVYSNGSHYDDKDVKALRKQLSVLMPELGVDMVLQGHDHVYLRTGVMDNNKVVDTFVQYLEKDGAYYKSFVQPQGSIYEISGTSGVKTYLVKDKKATDKEFPRAEKMVAVDAPMFSAFEIKDGVLYFAAYTVAEDGMARAVDRIAIQKDINQGNVAPDYIEAEDEAENESVQSVVETILKYIVKIMKVIFNLMKLLFIG